MIAVVVGLTKIQGVHFLAVVAAAVVAVFACEICWSFSYAMNGQGWRCLPVLALVLVLAPVLAYQYNHLSTLTTHLHSPPHHHTPLLPHRIH